MWSDWSEKMAIRCLERRCHNGEQDGANRSSWVGFSLQSLMDSIQFRRVHITKATLDQLYNKFQTVPHLKSPIQTYLIVQDEVTRLVDAKEL